MRRASSPEGWNKAWAVAFSGEDEQGPFFSLTLVTGGTEDATHPKCCRAPAYRHVAACNLSGWRNCICCRYENRSLADPEEGRGHNRKGGHGDCQGDGTRRCIRRAFSAAKSAAYCRRANLGNLGVSRCARRIARRRSRRTVVRCGNPGTASQSRKSSCH